MAIHQRGLPLLLDTIQCVKCRSTVDPLTSPQGSIDQGFTKTMLPDGRWVTYPRQVSGYLCQACAGSASVNPRVPATSGRHLIPTREKRDWLDSIVRNDSRLPVLWDALELKQ